MQPLNIVRLIFSWIKPSLGNAFAQVLKTSGGHTLTLSPLHLVLASMTPHWADARPLPAGEWHLNLQSLLLITVFIYINTIIAWNLACESAGAPINSVR